MAKKKKREEIVEHPLNMGWWQSLKKGLKVVDSAIGIILASPITLPKVITQAGYYVTLILGIVKAIDTNADE